MPVSKWRNSHLQFVLPNWGSMHALSTRQSWISKRNAQGYSLFPRWAPIQYIHIPRKTRNMNTGKFGRSWGTDVDMRDDVNERSNFFAPACEWNRRKGFQLSRDSTHRPVPRSAENVSVFCWTIQLTLIPQLYARYRGEQWASWMQKQPTPATTFQWLSLKEYVSLFLSYCSIPLHFTLNSASHSVISIRRWLCETPQWVGSLRCASLAYSGCSL